MPEPDMSFNDITMTMTSIQHKNIAETIPSFKLTQNQRVNPEEVEFVETLRKLGDGQMQDGDEGHFEFPPECLSDNVINDVYGTALATKNYDALHERVILTPLNKDANDICDEVLMYIEGQEKVYTSVDVLSQDNNLTNTERYPIEVLNAIDLNSMPSHELKLKVNAIIMLIRNLLCVKKL
ncbi:PIF1-like helicase domain-containing protein [Ditylenchus destructor]|uniref:PIF1-like helicase domain-containing protein n=1 Tax=Ditylenchus destructor TaxID=166010 RepID=A0AAD4QV48_9BILA|nr:PIF1-like helicase domain-containing protein [Ditylenchus destructor]